VSRVAVLWNPDNPAEVTKLSEVRIAARALRVQLQVLSVRNPSEFGPAFVGMTRERAGALLVLHDLLFLTHRDQILDFAIRTRLPVMYERREYVDAGGLVSYGVNFRDNFRRATTFVDKILKGAKPADLPVEQPTKFELVINRASREG
jgi:putative ABC transport system substrate-binding protein